ncbi:MAG: SGNH/GDSL hydrolase family protein [Chromatiales bacterium]|nr:SGNH/GDSL hydrolase family protein [Chromatiales bacterium]
MENAVWRGLSFSVLLTLAGVTFALLVAEGIVRAIGLAPWTPLVVSPGAPVMTEADAKLGWRNRPGQYLYKTRPDQPNGIHVLVDPDGGRFTRSAAQGQPVWFLGGSFTFGWAVDDAQPFPQVFADARPDRPVKNYAVPGYGTVQSYLAYQQRMVNNPARPADVVYGFIERHVERNRGGRQWLATLTRAAWPRGPIRLPYLGAGAGIEPPRSYRIWPLARFSALVNLVQNSYDREADRHLPDDAQASLLALLNRWRREVEQTGSRFHMIVLYDENRFMDYGQVFRRAGLDVIACAPTRYPAVDTQVPGDHHPNAGIHRLWGGCVARALTAEGGKE